MNHLVSIIVPIYNIELYLENCLDSLINQTYRHLEIILINDGSTDNSEEICLKYANKDERVKYFKQNNGGLSNARNNGILKSNGEFILFVDSDDFIELNTIEENLSLINDHNLQVIEFKSFRIEEFNDLEENCLIIENKNHTATRIITKKTFFVWNKIIHSSLAKQLIFIENQIYEDILYTFKLINCSKKYAFYNKSFYHYNITNNSSLSRNKYSIKQLDQIKSFEQTIDFIKNNSFDEEITKKLKNRLAFFYMNNFLNLSIFNLDKDFIIRKSIKSKLQKLVHSNQNINVKLVEKLPLFMSSTYFKFRNLIKK